VQWDLMIKPTIMIHYIESLALLVIAFVVVTRILNPKEKLTGNYYKVIRPTLGREEVIVEYKRGTEKFTRIATNKDIKWLQSKLKKEAL
jgi:hypothetical protein